MGRWPTLAQRAHARRAGAEVVPWPPAAGARSDKVARAAPGPDGAPRRWRGGPSHRAWSVAGRATTTLAGSRPSRRTGAPAREPRASEMRLRRPFEMATRALLTVAMCVAVPPAIHLASAGAVRLIDGDGIVHFTNVPEDPRYRGVRSTSGTALGWFSRSDFPWGQYAKDIREISLQHDVDPLLVQ